MLEPLHAEKVAAPQIRRLNARWRRPANAFMIEI
jgi:hypothetical protein